jgi:hypothetical protein
MGLSSIHGTNYRRWLVGSDEVERYAPVGNAGDCAWRRFPPSTNERGFRWVLMDTSGRVRPVSEVSKPAPP